ncbi:hypothetical protein [Bdellovibrio sp. BCCA]|uniref:hypothetical protein n=1 Tax=Bdellovibrio sp. BCCA TaxID=3136281 RepID=UPI0030F0F4A8
MKLFYIFMGILSVSSVSQATELLCTNAAKSLEVSIVQDGGEETLTVRMAKRAAETYLILYRDDSKVVSVNDSDINGSSSRGAILSFNTYGHSYLAYDGDVVEVLCSTRTPPGHLEPAREQ